MRNLTGKVSVATAIAALLAAGSIRTQASTVTLAWDPPTENVDGTPIEGLAGYRLYYGTTSGSYQSELDVGNVTQRAVTGLQDGGLYYASVKAYNTFGEASDFAVELAFTAPDQTPPVIVPPPATAVAAQADGQAPVPDLKGITLVTDNISLPANIVVTQTPAAGTRVGLGVTTVTLTATDEAGNQSQASVSVTVADNTPPTITPPSDVTLVGNANGQAAVPDLASLATVADNCSAAAQITVTQSPAAGTLVALGATTVTLTATDAAGNQAQATVVVTVTPGNQPPVVSAGPDRSTRLPDAIADLAGSVQDDGMGGLGGLTIAWTMVSGPGPVAFADASAAATRATFTVAGTYVLRLTANDGQYAASDDVQVVVRDAPSPKPPKNLRMQVITAK